MPPIACLMPPIASLPFAVDPVMQGSCLFWDVTTIFLNPTAFQYTIDLLVKQYRDQKIDVVAGFEARGLIFGAPLALALGVAFVPLRKPGKLPGQLRGRGQGLGQERPEAEAESDLTFTQTRRTPTSYSYSQMD